MTHDYLLHPRPGSFYPSTGVHDVHRDIGFTFQRPPVDAAQVLLGLFAVTLMFSWATRKYMKPDMKAS